MSKVDVNLLCSINLMLSTADQRKLFSYVTHSTNSDLLLQSNMSKVFTQTRIKPKEETKSTGNAAPVFSIQASLT